MLARKTRAGQTISFSYDTLNRVKSKTPPAPAPVVTYGYDLAGRLTSVSDTSAAITGAASPSGPYVASYSYDAMNRPTAASWTPAPAQAAVTASGVTFSHAYNKANQRIGQTATDNTWLNYPAATASTTSYTANALNQYTAVGAVTPSYDGNGSLTSDGTYTLGYDAENRLISASGAGTTASYTFDAQGRRKAKTVNGTSTVFVNDADNREVLEYDGSSGAILRWYAYGLGPNAVLNPMYVAAGIRTTLVPDVLGSIIGSLDSGSASLTKVGYLPYGKSASTGPFGFTGQRIDLETNGLYYYRARHYSPTWGRFAQVDPAGYRGNPYTYVGNDPLNAADPTGLYTLQIGIAGGATILGFVVPQAGFGIAIDTQGNIGSYKYVGAGVGVGVSADFDASLQVSNAQTIYDLSGAFNNASLHGGAGLGGSVDYFVGSSPDGPVSGGGITFGANAGGSVSVSRTTTQVCGTQGCAGEFRELMPDFSTPAAAAPQTDSPATSTQPVPSQK